MRDIKFRVWYPGEIKDGGYLFLPYMQYTIRILEFRDDGTIIYGRDGGSLQILGKSSVLMQYIGIKDKNGKEIYEGDIIKYEWKENPVKIAKVMYIEEESAFKAYLEGYLDDDDFITDDLPDLLGYSSDAIEVIGNIYQNPELLTPKL